jgi:hypothetical protein
VTPEEPQAPTGRKNRPVHGVDATIASNHLNPKHTAHPIPTHDVTHVSKLILIRLRAMMHLLMGQIRLHRIHVRRAHGKRSVPRLPLERGKRRKLLVYPTRGVRLDHAHHFGQRDRPPQRNEQMHVILNAARRHECAIVISQQAADVREQSGSHLPIQPRLAVLRAENDVHMHRGK